MAVSVNESYKLSEDSHASLCVSYPNIINDNDLAYAAYHRYFGVVTHHGILWYKLVAILKKVSIIIHVFVFLAGMKWGPSEHLVLSLQQDLLEGCMR